MSLTKESLIEWATSWVPNKPPLQKQRFTEALAIELKDWTPPKTEPVWCKRLTSWLSLFRRIDQDMNKVVKFLAKDGNSGAMIGFRGVAVGLCEPCKLVFVIAINGDGDLVTWGKMYCCEYVEGEHPVCIGQVDCIPNTVGNEILFDEIDAWEATAK